MIDAQGRVSAKPNLDSRVALIVVCAVAVLSYLVPTLSGKLISNPQTVWPLWPVWSILVAGLLLIEQRIWPLLIAISFLGVIVADVQAGVPISSLVWFIPADALQVLITAFGLRHFFEGVPQLDNTRALARYSFFAIFLAPFAAAFISAPGIRLSYWSSWRVSFFAEVLAFVTVTPALFSWINIARARVRKPPSFYVEAIVQLTGLAAFSFIAFTSSWKSSLPVLLYSLVPFLLWAALRLGPAWVNTSVIVVTFLSVWSRVHGRGPFAEIEVRGNDLPLQLFLVFAAAPFMILAAVVEERKHAEQDLRESEDRFRLAAQAGKMFAYQWDADTNMVTRSGDCSQVLGVGETDPLTGDQIFAKVHPEDQPKLAAALAELSPEKPLLHICYRLMHASSGVIWIERSSQAYFDEAGKLLRLTGMVADITARRGMEDALRESEERFVLAAQVGRVYAFEWQVPTGVVVRSPEYAEILGLTEPGFLTFQQFVEGIHPDDRAKFVSAITAQTLENPSHDITYRFLRPSGGLVWLKSSGRAFFDEEGKLARVVGMVADVTDQKLAEEALSNVSGRLIQAQEQERSRIARELHDDIGQRLALASVTLDMLEGNLNVSIANARNQADELRKQLFEISTDVQAVSHELHSSTLEHLGLVQAARGWCDQFGAKQHIDVRFSNRDIPKFLPHDVSLCLFRVLQEAVHNAGKHSSAKKVEVALWEERGEINLLVSDSGRGFDLSEATRSGGLGLASMRERVRFVNGTVLIDSKPMFGTTLHARIPLHPEYARRAVG